MKKNTILIVAIIFVVVIFVGLDYLNKKIGFRTINIKENFDIDDDKLELVNNLKNKKISFKLIDETNWLTSKNINETIAFYINNEGNVKGDIYNNTNELLTFNTITTDSIKNNNDNNRCHLELKPLSLSNNILDIKIIKNVHVANLFSENDDGDINNVEIRIAYKNSGGKSYYNNIIKIENYDITTDNIITLNTEDDNTRIKFYKIFLLKQLSVNNNNNIYHLSLKFTETNDTNSFYSLYGPHMEIYFNNVLDNDKIKDNSFEKNICTIEHTENNKIKKLICYFTITINATNNFYINIYNIKNNELLFTLQFNLKTNNYITKLVNENKNLREILETTEKFYIVLNDISQLLNDNYSIRTINFSNYTTDELNEFNKEIGTTLENSIYTDMYKLNRNYKRLENEYNKLNEYYILKKNLEKNYLNLKKI